MNRKNYPKLFHFIDIYKLVILVWLIALPVFYWFFEDYIFILYVTFFMMTIGGVWELIKGFPNEKFCDDCGHEMEFRSSAQIDSRFENREVKIREYTRNMEGKKVFYTDRYINKNFEIRIIKNRYRCYGCQIQKFIIEEQET